MNVRDMTGTGQGPYLFGLGCMQFIPRSSEKPMRIKEYCKILEADLKKSMP
jgi:hypothetical protein